MQWQAQYHPQPLPGSCKENVVHFLCSRRLGGYHSLKPWKSGAYPNATPTIQLNISKVLCM